MAGNPKLLVWTLCWSDSKWVGGRSYRLSPINLGGKKRELETDPWPANELRLAAHLENIHSYTVTHSWCDNFIPTSSSAQRPACCASGTKKAAFNKFRVFFSPSLEMLGHRKAIRVTETSDLFNVADSQTALSMLGGSEWARFDFRRDGNPDWIAEQDVSSSLNLHWKWLF